MSVLGTTFGIGEKATRPATEIAARAATRATIWEGGRERSYQANPPSSVRVSTAITPACQLTGTLLVPEPGKPLPSTLHPAAPQPPPHPGSPCRPARGPPRWRSTSPP